MSGAVPPFPLHILMSCISTSLFSVCNAHPYEISNVLVLTVTAFSLSLPGVVIGTSRIRVGFHLAP